MNILEKIRNGLTIFDGGMGTMLQAKGLKPGELPETWNLTHPDDVREVHAAYFRAGSQVVNANTFGANPFKYDGKDGRPPLDEIVRAGVKLALEARDEADREADEPGTHYAALDIGPLGKMLSPLGDLPFKEAVEAFAKVVRAGAAAGADLVMIETMNDSYETKAAVLAAKENCSLPVFVSVVYDEGGKLMTGADVRAMTAMLEGLGADAIGMNCSLGPAQMLSLVPELSACCSLPVLVKPNAGLPRSEGGRTVYDVGAEEFSSLMREIVRAGAHIIGGCCGTTPAYIEAMVRAVKDVEPLPVTEKEISMVSSYTHAVTFGDRCILIGERINPTGKKKLKQALIAKDLEYIRSEGIGQADAGADILDVNAGLPDIDEPVMLTECVRALQEVTDLPLQIDTSDPAAMESALRICNGKAMINSVNGKEEVLDAVLPLAKKYGGLLVCLTLDEQGIPETAEGRLAIARRILERAQAEGIHKKDLIFDPLALTVSSDPKAAAVTLESIRLIREELGCLTSLGVSNVSFGLPSRPSITSAFFTLAMDRGLSGAIINPYDPQIMNAYYSYEVLAGRDEGCASYIGGVRPLQKSDGPAPAAQAVRDPGEEKKDLQEAIVRGMKERAAQLAAALLPETDPLTLIQEHLVPALDIVGKGFEEKRVYLPQLLMSAEAASAAFEEVKKALPQGDGSANPVILATVRGDIHDIGKNIVKVLLENYGYKVIDLGRDVPPEKIVQEALEKKVKLVGLSALMTTTVPAMEETIRQLHEAGVPCKVIVGGAVLTQEYADMIHADAYGKTAMDTVRYADKVFMDV